MSVNSSNENDLGFGSKLAKSGDRLINKDGSFNIIRKGKLSWDAYQSLIKMDPIPLVGVYVLFFIGINSFFAILFMIIGVEQLAGVPEGNLISDFLYAFFFSVQTFTTVGYGAINPTNISANLIATLCAGVGLFSFAIMTGLFFARFSKPRSHIAFSEKAIISPYQDGLSFQCRIVNVRDHKIINLKAVMVMTWLESKGNTVARRFSQLDLERSEVVLFPLNWTLVHPIEANSPLNGKSLDDLIELQAEFLIMVTGFDESYNQIIHADSSYICNEIVTEMKFKPMYLTKDGEGTELNLDDLHALIKL